jgi:hypothetical protein
MPGRIAVLIVALLACGKPSQQDECKKLVSASCNKLFDCDKTKAMAQFKSEGDCEAHGSCDEGDAGCTFDEAGVNACVSDVSNESCSAASAGLPPSCAPAKVCPGAVTCGSESVTAGSSGCTYTVAGAMGPCSDGHTYGAHCQTATSCDCQVDGRATGESFSTSSDLCQQTGTAMDSALQIACGFNYHR